MQEILLLGVPLAFVLFAATLLGIACFHKYALPVALAGLAVVLAYRLGITGFETGTGFGGLARHLAHEWVILANLFALLTGFALLARHFETSRLPDLLPDYLPDNWTGGFCLLVLIFTLSGFLDNIAAAMIGGAMAHALFRGRVHIGFLAAIVAASNAGGSGSVVGDTTTTMMWLKGVSPLMVLEAYIASFTALLVFGIPAARLQQRYSPIIKSVRERVTVDMARIAIVIAMLGAAVAANVYVNLAAPDLAERFPVIGCAIWLALLASLPLRRPDWQVLPEAVKGSVFLLSLVLIASLMPVEALPAASPATTLGLGFVSAVFDNIPLTALALEQGGYDWGFLAFAVGFGGSMLWFGSSAGVALSNLFPEARSVSGWLRHGWPVIAGYLAGYAALYFIHGWQP